MSDWRLVPGDSWEFTPDHYLVTNPSHRLLSLVQTWPYLSLIGEIPPALVRFIQSDPVKLGAGYIASRISMLS